MTSQVDLGPVILTPLAEKLSLEGETPKGEAASGTARLYELRGPGGLHLTLRDAQWSNGERDVVAYERRASPELFDTLVERLRLSVLDYDGPYVELLQARLPANNRAQLYRADLSELNLGAALDVESTLKRFGALQVGTRAELIGDRGRTRHHMGARFARGATELPMVAYVLTRVCPISNRVSA